jgi:hypothetical protein
MGMPGVTKTSQFRTGVPVVFAGEPEVFAGLSAGDRFNFSIAAYFSESVLIVWLHCNELAISSWMSGALIRQRFDAAWAFTTEATNS